MKLSKGNFEALSYTIARVVSGQFVLRLMSQNGPDVWTDCGLQ